MTLRRKMDDTVRLKVAERPADSRWVGDVDPAKTVPLAFFDVRQGRKIRRIGQLVEVEHNIAGFADEVTANGGANKAGAAGH
jgi:hypothetical protein